MDVRFINPFVGSIKRVFRKTFDVEVLLGSPHVRRKGDASSEITALFGFAGDASGCIALCMPMRTAGQLVNAMNGAEVSTDDPVFARQMMELVHRIAGRAASEWSGLRVSMSLPRLVTGSKHRILDLEAASALTLPCDTPLGRFAIEAAMQVQRAEVDSEPSLDLPERMAASLA